MRRSAVRELHFICPIENLLSILQKGILCHNSAKELNPKSIAEPGVQDRRKSVVVPGVNKKLHEFVNLYLNARNPMMYKRKGLHASLCILSVTHEILDEPGVIITDMNASRQYVKFLEMPHGLSQLDKDLIYAKYWNHDDPIEKDRRIGLICAEVLVPRMVAPRFIQAIYVSCDRTRESIKRSLRGHLLAGKIVVRPYLFFLSGEDVK